jgi:predicted GNAT family acetyltransferase
MKGSGMSEGLRDNTERSRFERDERGYTVVANYRRQGTTIAITHVEAPPAVRGTGAASRLMEAITALARAEGAKLLPLCGYAAAWLRRHKEHRDLVA